jgi:type IX secretion system PorP/SprF family membrane protein
MLNQLYFNPAFAGNTQYPRFIGGYRNQWPGLGNAFVSYYASFDQYVDIVKGGVGFGMSRDVQGNGIFSKTSFDLMYSYPIEINGDMSANLGFQASMVQSSLNSSKLVLGDQSPYINSSVTENIGNQSKIFPDFSSGISFLYKEQYQINFSVSHLNRPSEMNSTTYMEPLPMRFTVQVLSQYPSKRSNRNAERIILRPGIMSQIQKNNNFFGWGCNMLYSSFTGGVWFRNDATLTLNTFVLLTGYTQGGFSIYYSYDSWLPKNYQQVKNYGAHEVTFIYLFQYNDPRKKMRIVKCPKF